MFSIERSSVKIAVVKTNTAAQNVAPAVHPLHKSHTLISTSGHVNYDNLNAIEAVSMTAVFVLAIGVGVLTSSGIIA